jgi:hypothetical protein
MFNEKLHKELMDDIFLLNFHQNVQTIETIKLNYFILCRCSAITGS